MPEHFFSDTTVVTIDDDDVDPTNFDWIAPNNNNSNNRTRTTIITEQWPYHNDCLIITLFLVVRKINVSQNEAFIRLVKSFLLFLMHFQDIQLQFLRRNRWTNKNIDIFVCDMIDSITIYNNVNDNDEDVNAKDD